MLINDPIYGFVSVSDPLIKKVIDHPYFQRLRRIKQMGLADLVFPGATHSRFLHALGSMHLAQKLIETLQRKKVEISSEEKRGLLLAALLHDIGHGPFSHSSEFMFFKKIPHEKLTLKIVEILNIEFKGKLSITLDILKGEYHKRFLSQIVAEQIDIDRLDYLNRDSYYTGISQGNIDVNRIIEMTGVHDGQLVYDLKSLHTLEKFLLDRRFMILQVYRHKTNLLAETLLNKVWDRSQDLVSVRNKYKQEHFLYNLTHKSELLDISEEQLIEYLKLDDSDLFQLLKAWSNDEDKTLSTLSSNLLNRKLPKIKFTKTEPTDDEINELIKRLPTCQQGERISSYFVFKGKIKTRAYKSDNDSVMVKNEFGKIEPLQKHAAFIKHEIFSKDQYKYFICHPK
ncbi:MAG: HD domain-containing protein [Flavobacteriaceae bacterium]|nr:HD domain-containing protein [Flavobacteriaceae bacterium]